MNDVPALIHDDPWLAPYEAVIRSRHTRLTETLEAIKAESGSLAAYATGHKFTGIHYHAADKHWVVREWAPKAKAVFLIGDFNKWNRESHPLAPAGRGIWQTRLPGDILTHGQLVKLHIIGADGSRRDRIPACIRRAVQDPATHDYCGQIWIPPDPYVWQYPFTPSSIGTPLIYEAHVGIGGEEPRVHQYREFATHIIPRIAASGYNMIQLMAVQEHPYYGSFGYHVSSFFAPCSRFGTPDDLKHLIDTAHSHGIAVLLDIVHSHAVKNIAEGLNDFDGSGNQYFHAGPHGEHPQWDSKCFDYSRPEVRQFLLSNLRYWIEEFHFDGFRFDGVTSMLYHHHGQQTFDHYDKYFGPDADDDSILYLQLATTLLKIIKPGAVIIAEDMSGMPGLCRAIEDGGCGFTHRLAMGIPDHWIKLLKHSRDEDWDLGQIWSVLANRRYGEATVAYAESHDQALVGDKTLAFWLMDKEMYWNMSKSGNHPVIERGIALHKMIRLLTFGVGGEAWLNFMGNEFGHPEWLDFPREGNGWSYHYCRRQWSLADNPDLRYRELGEFDRAMLDLQNHHHLLEAPPAGLIHIDDENKILCFSRGGLVFVFNFSVNQSPFNYPIKCPVQGPLHLIIDSDAERFGGHARVDDTITYPVSENGVLTI